MYKIFLCLRYLKSRVIAWFAVLAVTLCVAMLVIVVSVMNGFLDKIEDAAKGLFGDIVVSGSGWGLARYDEFIDRVTENVDGVEAGSPVVFTQGVLRFRYDEQYQQGVQVVGIDLPERAAVTDFEEGLIIQAGSDRPSWDPSASQLHQAVKRIHEETVEDIRRMRNKDPDPASRTAEERVLLRRLRKAESLQDHALSLLKSFESNAERIDQLERRIEQLRDRGASMIEIGRLQSELAELREAGGLASMPNRAILGAMLPDVGFRTQQGRLVPVHTPPMRALLYIFPLESIVNASGLPEIPPALELSAVDLCQTGVHNIDSSFVYIPLSLAQKQAKLTDPARVSQIHLKVGQGLSDETSLANLAARVQSQWDAFQAEHPGQPLGSGRALTWRQMQAHIIEPIESQRTLVVLMFAVISLVAVVLIFVIFYMIVLQKTKDIGILKAIGAGGWGVAGIFLLYGAVIGLIGSVLGTILGYVFVIRINPIHDWLGDKLGFRVWRMETFMFDRIPNRMDWSAAAMVIVGAIVAGLLGAMVPALRAARMQPVEALRYE